MFNILIISFITTILFSGSFAHAISCGAYFKSSDLLRRYQAQNGNPILDPSPYENGFFPSYDKIKPEHFIPALEVAKAEALLKQLKEDAEKLKKKD